MYFSAMRERMLERLRYFGASFEPEAFELGEMLRNYLLA
jgi:hypothetical protein